MNKLLFFDFHRLIKDVDINDSLRVSVWLENNDYLMPCRFTNVLFNKNEDFKIVVDALDPDNCISCEDLNKTFYFGHPGKIFGKGVLNEIKENIQLSK